MWPWQQKTVIDDTFSARLHRVETDCLARLNFVEAQLRRATRPDRTWSAHMTVVDADIVPAGRVTRVLSLVGEVHAWPWWLYLLIALASLLVVLGLVALF